MNVFETLIEDLKDEDLLEETILVPRPSEDWRPDAKSSIRKPSGMALSDVEIVGNELQVTESVSEKSKFEIDPPKIEKPADRHEFFRKRAIDEVSSLQMVEHVLSGVEREHMKIVPVSFDDFDVKRALHDFLKVSNDLNSPNHAEAEYLLRQETESWNCALSERDQKISVADIRRFCENSVPVLSSQALMALARFYRNSPFSEDVRGKFDYVFTRLFSRDIAEAKRRLLFPRDEMLTHISTLFANWSSIAVFSPEDDHTAISNAAAKFEGFIGEVESAANFDRLVEAGFFNRVRLFKEKCAELAYVPQVAAAAIESNLRIGNRYVELIEKEKLNANIQAIEEKYGYTHDQIISNTAGKTLLLVDLLRLTPDNDFSDDSDTSVNADGRTKISFAERETQYNKSSDLFALNKWLMIALAVSMIASGGVYFWSEKGATADTSDMAKTVKFDDPEVNQHLGTLSESNETLFAVTLPAYKDLSDDKKKEFLKKIFTLAVEKRLRKVSFFNSEGRIVAFASNDRLEILNR